MTKVYLFAHDAASANMVYAQAIELMEDGCEVKVFGDGPAEKILKAKLPDVYTTSEPVFECVSMVVTGLSGVHSKYELFIIKKAREANVPKIISILDIPRNVDRRFEIDGVFLGEDYLADEIWCEEIDFETKYEIIRKRAVKKPNPYLTLLSKKYASSSPVLIHPMIHLYKNEYILYLCDYVIDQFGETLGFTEFSMLESFFGSISKCGVDRPIYIKLHPAEKLGKYDNIVKSFKSLNIHIIDAEIHELVYFSNVVFGISSSVFHECELLDKEFYSLQIGRKDGKKDFPWSAKEIIYSIEQLDRVMEHL